MMMMMMIPLSLTTAWLGFFKVVNHPLSNVSRRRLHYFIGWVDFVTGNGGMMSVCCVNAVGTAGSRSRLVHPLSSHNIKCSRRDDWK